MASFGKVSRLSCVPLWQIGALAFVAALAIWRIHRDSRGDVDALSNEVRRRRPLSTTRFGSMIDVFSYVFIVEGITPDL